MFTDIFGDAPRVRLLDFFADHPDFDYTISQMAEFAEIARPTVYKLVEELVGQDMLIFTRSVGDSRFYRLNLKDPRVVSMLQVEFEGINREVAAGVYEETPGAATQPRKSSAGSRARVRLPLRRRTVPVRNHGRAARKKNLKSSE